MTGETDLDRLLSQMRPELDPLVYVFCTFADRSMSELAGLAPIGLFAEAEGVTAILPARAAEEAGIKAGGRYRRITLTVHSSLQAVGLTAAVSAALAERGIPANIVAAYFHDHVFVPEERAGDAVGALEDLSRSAS